MGMPRHTGAYPCRRPCTACGMKQRRRSSIFPRPIWGRRRRSITLAACKIPRHRASRITGRSARDGRGAATLRRAGASSGRATVRSGFCGPDCAAHHRRRRFHLQALTSDGSSRPGPEAVRRGKQRPEACSPALVSWWRAGVGEGILTRRGSRGRKPVHHGGLGHLLLSFLSSMIDSESCKFPGYLLT